MKILMFTPYVPYPPNSGGQIRTFNLIKNLSKKHEITSFSFRRSDHGIPELTELKKYCRQVRTFSRKKSFQSPLKILRTGFSRYPYLVNMYRHRQTQQAIAQELSSRTYDLIHVETYYIMPNLPNTSVPVLLAEQTIEYQVYQHYASSSPIWPIKPLLYIDVVKHKYWERHYWQEVKKVVAMSEADKQKMLQLIPNLNVSVVPNGVDTTFFQEKISNHKPSNTVLFVGNFNWLQNREAAEVLAKNIWPKIKAKLPGAKLWIVGREPKENIKRLATSDITISGDIEDIRTAFQGANVLVAPLYGAGGTRYKILEAMASGLPVVTTRIGIEGIGATNGRNVLLADSNEEIANLTIEIIKNQNLAKKIAISAKEFVYKNFDWKSISNSLEQIYEETARKN